MTEYSWSKTTLAPAPRSTEQVRSAKADFGFDSHVLSVERYGWSDDGFKLGLVIRPCAGYEMTVQLERNGV